ncbi:MAG: hypothetical protein ACI9EW_001133 [Cellvibrionaceae bacterium]|jgi:hypothetical protein
MNRSIIVAIPILLMLTILQVSVLTVLPILDQVVQPVVLCAIAWGMLRGLGDGLIWAFMGGLFLDLFSIGPWGGHSIAIMLSTALAVWIVTTLPPRQFWIPGIIGGICAVVYLMVLVGLIQISRYGPHWSSLPNVGVFFVVQGSSMVLFYWLLFLLRQWLYPSEVTGRGLG